MYGDMSGLTGSLNAGYQSAFSNIQAQQAAGNSPTSALSNIPYASMLQNLMYGSGGGTNGGIQQSLYNDNTTPYSGFASQQAENMNPNYMGPFDYYKQLYQLMY